jgi:hypothetical protein
VPLRRNANGTTISESVGAATMPKATKSWPLAMPSATKNGKAVRDTDSEMIRKA